MPAAAPVMKIPGRSTAVLVVALLTRRVILHAVNLEPHMAAHSPGFLALVNDAKLRIKQVHAREVPAILKANPKAKLIDTREESEFAAGHVRGAEWIGKG